MFANDGTPVTVIADSPGFVTQRIVAMIVNIGCIVAEAGNVAPDNIDRAATLGIGYPFGPLAFGDRLGSDLICRVLNGIHHITSDDRYLASRWLTTCAESGHSLLTPDV